MTTTFDNRERGYENKYTHDKELEFKILAKRNKLIAEWVAEKLGIVDESKKNYIKNIVEKTVQNDDSEVIKQISGDLISAGIKITLEEIEQTISQFFEIAKQKVVGA